MQYTTDAKAHGYWSDYNSHKVCANNAYIK